MQRIKNFFAQQAQRRAERAADAKVRNRKITKQDLSLIVEKLNNEWDDAVFELSPFKEIKHRRPIAVWSEAAMLAVYRDEKCLASELKLGGNSTYKIRIYEDGSCDIENKDTNIVSESFTLEQALNNIAAITTFHVPEKAEEIYVCLKSFLVEQKQQPEAANINTPTP